MTRQPRPSRHLFFDMAGTILDEDRDTGRLVAMPDLEAVLPELRTRYKLHVTTGDFTARARALLREVGLLPHFAQVHGGLWAPAGKPYGAICSEIGADPGHCLAIGDRPGVDLPGDTDRVVTLLLQPDGMAVSARLVAALVDHLVASGPDFPAAFDALWRTAGPRGDGEPSTRSRDDGIGYLMRRIEPAGAGTERRVLVLWG